MTEVQINRKQVREQVANTYTHRHSRRAVVDVVVAAVVVVVPVVVVV